MKKTFLFLAALAMSAMTWAGETKTLIIDGSQLTSTATSAVTDFTYGDFTIAMSDGAKAQGSSGDNRFEGTDKAILIGKSGKYIYNKTPFGKITKFELYANKGASTKVSVGVLFSTTAISEYATGDNTYTATLSTVDNVYDCSDKIPEGAKYFWYQVTNANNSQVMFRITYEDGGTPATLDSLVIKGKAEKMEYEVGEAFDPAGLEVWGIYTKTVKHDSTSQITKGITWTIDPETFAEVSDNASVTLSVSYKDLTSADTTITGINVKAAVVKMDVAFDFTTNLYGHKGVSSGSGDSYVSDGDIAVGEKFNEDPAQIRFTVNGSTQTRFWDASSKHELRLYNGATFVLSLVGDYKIIKVEFTGSAVNLTGNGVTVSDKVWEGDAAKSVTFVNSNSGSKINSIKVTYIAADPAVENPTITPDTVAGVYWKPITVTLATTTEGAAIYYTINGDVPTAASTLYEAPFQVSATTTVKAIAIKSGLNNSEVVSETFTFGEVYATLADLVNAGEPKGQTVKVTLTDEKILSLVSTNGIMLKATEDKEIEIFGYDRPKDWVAGGTVSGTLVCPWKNYQGTWELCPTSWSDLTYTAPGDPTRINNVKANAKATKAIVNGQIVIVRDNKTYNVLGF